MATQVLRDATIYLHDVAVSDIASSVDLSLGMETQDSTTFGASARKYAGGLFTAEMSAGGYADMSNYDGSLVTNYRARAAAAVTVTADSADNSVAYFFAASNRELTPFGGSAGDMAGVSIGATTRDAYGAIRGNILLPLGSRNNNGSGTARQLGAVSSTQRVFGALHVTSVSGGTLQARVQSDDNSGMTTPTNRISFTSATTTTSEMLSTAGPITDDWWRADWTISGGTFSFVIVVGIA